MHLPLRPPLGPQNTPEPPAPLKLATLTFPPIAFTPGIMSEKTYGHFNKICYHQIWSAGKLRGTSSVQVNLKITDDVMMQRSRDFRKTNSASVSLTSTTFGWLKTKPLIYLALVWRLPMITPWGDHGASLSCYKKIRARAMVFKCGHQKHPLGPESNTKIKNYSKNGRWNHGVIILNRSNNSVFLYLKIY